MAEPTYTRKELRRAICAEARMEFYKRYPDYELTPDSDCSTTTLKCSKLVQAADSWKSSYIWVMSTDNARDGLERYITASGTDGSLTLEWPCDTDQVPSTDDTFEIISMWPPSFIHEKINDVVRDEFRVYPNVVTDESIVIQEEKLEYDLTGLVPLPWQILQVYVERTTSGLYGTITSWSTDGSQFGDTTMDLSGVDTDWKASFYYGSGAGQLFSIQSVDTAAGLITPAVPAADMPGTDTKLMLWDPTDQDLAWYPYLYCRFDQTEFPDKLYLYEDPSASYGLRFRLVYLAQSTELIADSDVTTVPQYFIVHKVLAMLHDSLSEDNRVDARRHTEIAEKHDQLARDFAMRNPRRLPQRFLWQEPGSYATGRALQVNPLDW